MAKDPATLWYWNDWLTGTMTFSRHLKGCYMDLLGAQFNNGHLSLEEIKTVLGSDFGSSWPTIQKKFKQDSSGLFFNEKAEETKNKRSAYTKSRRQNLMGDHMENEIEKRKLEFINEVSCHIGFSEEIKKDFCNYWTENSKNGNKMRFEKQDVFDIPRRLTTWKNNEIKFKKPGTGKADNIMNVYNEAQDSLNKIYNATTPTGTQD